MLDVSSINRTAVDDSMMVSPVRTRCVNYFASLQHDYSLAHSAALQPVNRDSSAGHAQAHLSNTVSTTGHGDKQRPFVDPPSTLLPTAKLKELCLGHLAQRLGHMDAAGSQMKLHGERSSGDDKSVSRLSRTRRELKRKLRSGVAAVVFSNLLTQMRLRSIAKNLESHRCEPYRVLPAARELDGVCGRAVCVFAALQAASDDLLYFVLDRCPLPTEGAEWQVFPCQADAISVFLSQFQAESMGDGASTLRPGCIKLLNVLVIAEYDEHQRHLVPVAVEHLAGQTNVYFQILRDFEHRVNSITISIVREDPVPPDIFAEQSSRLDASAVGRTTSPVAAMAATFGEAINFLDIPLPTYQEMCVMPVEVRQAVQQLAVSVFRRCLLPRVLLRQRRRQRERLSRVAAPYAITVEQMLKLQTFEMWPPSLLDELIQHFKPYAAERGEIVLQEKENPCNAVYFLTSGTVQQIQKIDRTSKRISATNTKVLQAAISPVVCFGQLSFLSSDPRMSSIKTVTPCTFWRLFRSDYFKVFNKLPVSVRHHVQDLAFQRRTQSIPYNEPLTVGMLKQMPVFATCSEVALKALLPLFRPTAVPPGRELSIADSDGTAMYVLLRGRCGVFRYLRDRKEDAHVQSISPPTMIGDDAVVGGGSHVASIKTLTSCDLYVITKEDFEVCMSKHGADWNLVVEQATRSRQLRLLDSQDRFKEMAVSIPIVANILPFAVRTELSRLFKPILYHPKQTVCASAHFADRVIIVVEGTVRFQDGRCWECGEAAGYTCIVPHRWAQTATAVTSSKLIELPYQEYKKFLERQGALESVRAAVQALMFPKAAPPQTLYWALMATQKLQNPPMYPMSQSERVNLCEEKFGMRVMTLGQHKVHRRAAPHESSALELEVQASMNSISERVAKLQIARNYTPIGATVSELRPRPSSALGDDKKTSASWSTSGLLLMKHEHQPTGAAGAPRPMRNVDHHPIMREYLDNRRRPVGFRRPWGTMQGDASHDDSSAASHSLRQPRSAVEWSGASGSKSYV